MVPFYLLWGFLGGQLLCVVLSHHKLPGPTIRVSSGEREVGDAKHPPQIARLEYPLCFQKMNRPTTA